MFVVVFSFCSKWLASYFHETESVVRGERTGSSRVQIKMIWGIYDLAGDTTFHYVGRET